jgi:DNA adenine methylase
MAKIERPVLRYHGGKFLLANWIIAHFPPHRTYTEVFGGGGSVLLKKPRSYSEVYNDKWDTVVNVFRVLRDPVTAARLEQLLELTPFARTEFAECGEDNIELQTDPVEKARMTILRSFAGFGSASTNAKHSTGFRSNSNRSGTTPAQDWRNYPQHIKSFVERLQGVVIENRDYKDVLQQHDADTTLHFMDPPYVHSTRNMRRGNAAYFHEFSDQDHIDMAKEVEQLKGIVIICGYESELYDELFGKWYKVRRKALADGASERVEVLWMNRKPTTLF